MMKSRKKFITYANAGIKPFEGYDIAYSYLEFSRWKYQANNNKEAIQYAKIASNVDNTWAEPDFIQAGIGFYLVLIMQKTFN